MPPKLPTRPGGGPVSEPPLDKAFTLLLKGDTEGAARQALAVLRKDPGGAFAPFVVGQACAKSAPDVARGAFLLAARNAVAGGLLPLAVAACHELVAAGGDGQGLLKQIASLFARGSRSLSEVAPSPPMIHEGIEPLPAALTGLDLIDAASQELETARAKVGEDLPTRVTSQPFFSALGAEGLRLLLGALTVRLVAVGEPLIKYGEPGTEAYFLARGEADVSRPTPEGGSTTLAKLYGGSLFGEMALLSRTPRAASVVTARPSVLLVARRDALEKAAQAAPEIGAELASYTKARMVQNLLKISTVLRDIAQADRSALIERFATMAFEPGDVIIREGEISKGLHLIASGEVDVVRQEGKERLQLARLGTGDVAGEVSLVLRRPSTASVLSSTPTVTLFLPARALLGVIKAHPSIIATLYEIAVQRDEETTSIVAEESVPADDVVLI